MPDEPEILPPTEPSQPPRRFWPLAGIALALAAIGILYRLLVFGHMEQTALMFTGLPLVLAILVSLIPPSKTVTGMIMKGITLFLLMLGILLVEGFICILMASPLFYAIGFIVGIFADRARAQKDVNNRFRIILIPALALMSLEGITGALSFPRDELVIISREVPMPINEARTHLAKGPDFDLKELPPFLKLGFPMPETIEGTGIQTGDTWRIHFAGGEGEPGDLVATVVENSANHIRVTRTSDTSHIAHWLDWQEADWKLEPTSTGTTVTLTIRYRRLLDPAWYFKPIERYGVRKAGDYFIDQTFSER